MRTTPRSSRSLTSLGAAALALAGCSHEESGANAAEVNIDAAADGAGASLKEGEPERTTPTPVPSGIATTSPLALPTAAAAGGDNTSLPEVPATPGGAQEAATVVETYYALIGEGKYAEAWRLWDRGGQSSGMSEAAFAASFAKFATYHANVGAPGPVEGAAGSRYVTVPVEVTGKLKQGAAPFRMVGSVTLRRVGEVDGATPEQRRWHLYTADIKPRPVSTTPATARYRCIDGSRFTASFDSYAGTARLLAQGKLVAALDDQHPAAGIWYKRGATELRGEGKTVTFTRAGQPPLPCTSG